MFFPLPLLKKIKPQKENTEEEKDIPLSVSLMELENSSFTLCFENGLSVIIQNAINGLNNGIMRVRVLTPTKDITHRFKSLLHWRKDTDSPTELASLLYIISKFPNVYSVGELPDSCFNFKGCF